LEGLATILKGISKGSSSGSQFSRAWKGLTTVTGEDYRGWSSWWYRESLVDLRLGVGSSGREYKSRIRCKLGCV
jgi:hypothetical protein